MHSDNNLIQNIEARSGTESEVTTETVTESLNSRDGSISSTTTNDLSTSPDHPKYDSSNEASVQTQALSRTGGHIGYKESEPSDDEQSRYFHHATTASLNAIEEEDQALGYIHIMSLIYLFP